jgi:acyl-CoA synthetase (NDP forming)
MVTGLAEAIVGYRHDPLVGPVVLVGMGGQLAEIYRDTALECAPVSEEQAHAMIARIKGFALLRGYRNLPRGDMDALARTVAAVSCLAFLPGQPVAEAEINPVMVLEDGVVAVDGLVVLKGTA